MTSTTSPLVFPFPSSLSPSLVRSRTFLRRSLVLQFVSDGHRGTHDKRGSGTRSAASEDRPRTPTAVAPAARRRQTLRRPSPTTDFAMFAGAQFSLSSCIPSTFSFVGRCEIKKNPFAPRSAVRRCLCLRSSHARIFRSRSRKLGGEAGRAFCFRGATTSSLAAGAARAI